MSMLKKIGGKIISYLGLLQGINGLVYDNLLGVFLGIFFIIIGCIIHELSEQ